MIRQLIVQLILAARWICTLKSNRITSCIDKSFSTLPRALCEARYVTHVYGACGDGVNVGSFSFLQLPFQMAAAYGA